MSLTVDQFSNVNGFPKAAELIEITGAHALEASDRAIFNQRNRSLGSGTLMADVLSPDDRRPLPSTGLPRWENTTQFARYSMVRGGLLKPDSARGTLAISVKGLEQLHGMRTARTLRRRP